SEQSIVEQGKRRWITKEDNLGNSTMLLNPTDPEATYRRKAGKEYRGYVANVEETVGKNGSVVTSYEYESNIHSDSQFIKEHLEALPKQEENTSMIVDGAYYSEEAETMAAEKNIELLPTALTAKKNRRDVSGFEMDEEKTKVIKCPAGNTPRSCCYKKSNDEFKITFDSDVCANCPHKEQCHAKIFKNIARVLITKKSLIRLALEERMSSETYNLYRRIRNGVETIPSILRKNYHLEKLPRGKQRGRFFFGSKIAALNFRKFFHYVKGSLNYAETPILA
ncbi:MAG: transposase, partial [Bariatricus sp.]|nr:transposase [Bariatricus sp.]